MVSPGQYKYLMEAQNSFVLFAYSSPPIQSPRENIERSLPIYDDNEHQNVVHKTQNLDEDSGEDKEEYKMEDEDEDIGEASEPKGNEGKMKRQNWTKKQEDALAKTWVQCSLNKKKGNQQKSDVYLRKILEHYNATVGASTRTIHQDRIRGSGCDDVDVMKRALRDYQSISEWFSSY
ncbi:hypothetical protein Hdeb2414_s0023g00631121 [Helianthus debilis subsp. tardiflorus]